MIFLKEFIASCLLLKGDRKRDVTVSTFLVLKENPKNGLFFAIPQMPQRLRVQWKINKPQSPSS